MRMLPAVSAAVWVVVAVAAGMRMIEASWPAVIMVCSILSAAASVAFIDFGRGD